MQIENDAKGRAAPDEELDRLRALASIGPRRRQRAQRRILFEELRAWCARRFEETFHVPWNPQWAFWSRLQSGKRPAAGSIRLRPSRVVAELSRKRKKPGARGLADRALLVRFLDINGRVIFYREGQIPDDIRRGFHLHLSATEIALVSLLGGNRPRLRITDETSPQDVFRAEVDALKKILDDHGRIEATPNHYSSLSLVMQRPERGKKRGVGT